MSRFIDTYEQAIIVLLFWRNTFFIRTTAGLLFSSRSNQHRVSLPSHRLSGGCI